MRLLAFSGAIFVYSLSNFTESPAFTKTEDYSVPEVIPIDTYRIVKTYPHDPNAFTQGLAVENSFSYEGTGRRGHSTLRRVDLKTGNILQTRKLSAQFFGEGITIFGDKIIQLTWRSNVGFVYDKYSFKLLREFNYSVEGWGITHDGERLIISNGTSKLYLLDLKTFEHIGTLDVKDINGPVTKLNELEYVRGELYANVWRSVRIARISPRTGKVVGWIDLNGLLRPKYRIMPVGVLNGIAYDAKHNQLFVTGKLWSRLFEIELIPAE